jgi:hypothetical protein
MNNDQLLAYLKAGGWGGYQRRVDKPVTIGPRTFPSQSAAYRYVKQMVLSQEPGVMFQGDDLAIILDVIKRHPNWPYYQRHQFISFTVRPHVDSKMLTGLVSKTRQCGDHIDISVARCFDMEVKHVTKSVVRQDDVEWVIA